MAENRKNEEQRQDCSSSDGSNVSRDSGNKIEGSEVIVPLKGATCVYQGGTIVKALPLEAVTTKNLVESRGDCGVRVCGIYEPGAADDAVHVVQIITTSQKAQIAEVPHHHLALKSS